MKGPVSLGDVLLAFGRRTIEIKNEKQARIYNRFLVAKIIGQTMILAILIIATSATSLEVAAVLVAATIWQVVSIRRRRM